MAIRRFCWDAGFPIGRGGNDHERAAISAPRRGRPAARRLHLALGDKDQAFAKQLFGQAHDIGFGLLDGDGWTWATHYVPFYAATLLVTWLQ